ncbi:SurA N-terminal domain-containing protein [Patescibacteria group bacterium]|nr:SurA N-terminal domain-containing protein [Patescibacteria group bacterium]
MKKLIKIGIKFPEIMKIKLPRFPFCKVCKEFIAKNKIFSIGILAMVIAFLFGFLLKGTFVAATVNGRPIGRLAVLRELEKRQGAATLDGLITEEIIKQEAKKAGIKVSKEDINSEIETIRNSLVQQGQTLEQVLEFQGMNLKELESQIAIQKMIEQLLADKTAVTDEEINQYIEQNSDSFPEGTNMDQLKDIVRQQLSQQKLGSEFQTWFDGIKAEAKINYLRKY